MKNFDKLVSEKDLKTTQKALEKNGISVYLTENGQRAKELVLRLVPKGAEVMTASVTGDLCACDMVTKSAEIVRAWSRKVAEAEATLHAFHAAYNLILAGIWESVPQPRTYLRLRKVVDQRVHKASVGVDPSERNAIRAAIESEFAVKCDKAWACHPVQRERASRKARRMIGELMPIQEEYMFDAACARRRKREAIDKLEELLRNGV